MNAAMYRPKPSHLVLSLLVLTAAMFAACLWPYNSAPLNEARWVPGGRGIRIAGMGCVVSREPFPSLARISPGGSLTIEITVRPAKEDLAAANSMIAISSFGSTAVGFAASGLIAAYSIELAFYIDALTFLISGLLIMMVKNAPLKVEEDTRVGNVVRNLQVRLKYLFDNQVLRSLFFIGLFIWLGTGLWNTLLLPLAQQVLGADEFQYGIQEGLTSIGFVVGSLVMASYNDRFTEGQWVIISLLGWGVVGTLYALSSSLPIATFFAVSWIFLGVV